MRHEAFGKSSVKVYSGTQIAVKRANEDTWICPVPSLLCLAKLNPSAGGTSALSWATVFQEDFPAKRCAGCPRIVSKIS
jgi:hypothetical protein